ncbi:hypothetical protein PGT21_000980 [Puccinia graminis f. sp. tritici]|uniref:Uncharacterized protein n=1 Tax=Puccinia graminis f. sp. tritici TaxID=56615 RepID=A0A5B0SJ96_PUCGR|nr:hypothetical protein PGT21_001947 [Puccinia graminis f. sp. tritici]KAA1112529.1 hypothetical protein PGT21_000980 [Puccinia graminis f. sp. tritici]KAA1134824.1 hypothetical protein PGTUg99_015213 [Puccinia graminis f. sp. tritici]KAA1137203.1 hypothetical protein PGTUg99_014562 [Puccinia graminis f. sp. tritici]
MWSSNNQTNKRLTPNLKQLKLVCKVPELQPPQCPPPSDPSSSTTESVTNPSTWRKELKLTRVVERERKKLSTATASSCSTTTSLSSSTSRVPPTPSDLPRLDDRLSLLDEKLESVENMFSARKQMFELLGKDSDLLNIDLQKEIQRNSQSFQSSRKTTAIIKPLQKTESSPPTSGAVETTEESNKESAQSTEINPEAGWGGYFKKLW